MAILVTGGAGFIGSHTCVELLNAGEEIVVMDNFYNSNSKALDGIRKITGKDFRFYEADMLDIAEVDRIFAENDIEQVIHFAGYKCVPELYDQSIVANTEKKVPLEWINEAGNGETQGFIAYCLPLIQGETGMVTEDGLPRFVHLKRVVAKIFFRITRSIRRASARRILFNKNSGLRMSGGLNF